VLPGVAYLEMVRAALALALPDVALQDVEFQDHAWLQPVIVDREVEITVALFDNVDAATGERHVDYEISSDSAPGNAHGNTHGSTLHCRGSARWGSALPSIDAIDVGALSDAIQHQPVEAAALYRRFAELGLRYGPSMQGIVRLATNGEEVQAQLRLPDGLDPLTRDFGLHPSILDAAMQCSICLVAGFGSNNTRAALPFSFDTMRVCTATSRDMFAWVRLSAASGSLKKFDIDLVDESGAPCVQIRGLLARTIAEPAVSAASSIGKKPAQKPALRMLLPVWNPVSFEHGTVTLPAGEKCLLLGGDERLYRWLREALGDLEHWEVPPDASIASIKHKLSSARFDHLLWFAPEGAAGSIVDSQNTGVLSLFRIIKALTQLDYLDQELKLTIVTFNTQQVFDTDTVEPHHAGVHGLVGSVAKEIPLWRIRLLDIESIDNVTAREMLALPWDEPGRGLVYRHDAWLRQEFANMDGIPATEPGYKRNGVYVVIGGAGGIGQVWTRHLVEHFDADVIWIGRRPLDERVEAKLDAIAAFGKRPLYFAADAGDEAALAAAVTEIGKRFPRIDGVVHSALVLQDRSVRGMDETVFRQSLVAKVDMSVNLEKVFRDHDLDFMLFFSSVSSFTRGAGQSNYCAGCTFQDSFAHRVRAAHRYPVKVVNWGYWGSVGVVADEFHRKRMEKMGVGSIEPEEAMQVLQQFVASDLNQIVCVKVLSDTALDELLVSEEIRYYTDLDMSNESLG
jgi:NADP-dependent 3-hydroxy acid dehydrogenase YdfG